MDRHAIGNREREVQVRPAVAWVMGQGANHGPSDDARIRRRPSDDTLVNTLAFSRCEHSGILRRVSGVSEEEKGVL
jgi:hypothetical protein